MQTKKSKPDNTLKSAVVVSEEKKLSLTKDLYEKVKGKLEGKVTIVKIGIVISLISTLIAYIALIANDCKIANKTENIQIVNTNK